MKAIVIVPNEHSRESGNLEFTALLLMGLISSC